MRNKIKELKSLTDLSSNDSSDLNSFKTNLKDFKDFITDKNKVTELGLKTYDNKSQNYIELKNNIRRNSLSFLGEKNQSLKRRNKINIGRKELSSFSKFRQDESKESYKQYKVEDINSKSTNIEATKIHTKQKENNLFSFNIF